MRRSTIWAQPLGGQWTPIGAHHGRGIRAEDLVLSSDDWGSALAKFDLRRNPRALWPDIGAFTPLLVEIDGLPVWSGRVKDTPTRDGDHTINVQAAGWQAHLDDHAVERFYVHNRLQDWKDTRGVPGMNLAYYRQGAQVNGDLGQTVLSFPTGYVSPSGADFVGITLDVGPGVTADSISIDWESSNNAPDVYLYARGGNPLAANDAVAGVALNTGASGTSRGAFPSASRYVHVFIYFGGSPATFTTDVWLRLKEIRVFGASSYRSTDTSVLRASDVVADVAGLPEHLSGDLSLIEESSFSLPEYAPRAGRTYREHITAANAYEDWQARVEVDRRLRYRPRPSSALLVSSAASGFTFDDASANSADETYNAARIEADKPDGTPLRFVRSGAGGTLVDLREFTRSKTLPVRSTLTQAAGERIADMWLEGVQAAPLKGKAQVVGDRAISGFSGQRVPPHSLLLHTGELLRMDHLTNPVTGGLGRNGRITQVTYFASEDRAEVDIDNTRATFEALIARFDAIVGRS